MIRRKKHRLCPEWVQIKMLFPAKQNLFLENMHYDKMRKNGGYLQIHKMEEEY